MNQNPTLEPTFTTDYHSYKQMASEFFKRLKALPVPTEKQVRAGLHALGIGYLEMTPSKSDPRTPEMQRFEAEIVLTLAHRKASDLLGYPI